MTEKKHLLNYYCWESWVSLKRIFKLHILNQMLLQIYERHVPLRIEFFILGSLLMLFLGLSVVLSQTIRAANANPVNALKYE